MAIAFDASSESHTGTTGSASEGSFSWTHTPVGTPKGVLIFTFVNANADDATSVTYGGVNVPVAKDSSLNDIRAVDTTGSELGDCKAWFLGSGVPTGSQTVTVTRNNNANVMYAVAITVTSSQDSAVHTGTGGIVLIQTDTSLTYQSITDGSSGTGNSMRFAAANSGSEQFSTTPIKPDGVSLAPFNADSTWLHGIDFGTRVCGVVRQTTASTGPFSIGFLSPTRDTAAIHLVIKDVVVGATTVVKDLINGFGIMPFKR